MADERSVDVDEPKDHPPGAGSGPPAPRQIRDGLSPVQKAHSRYSAHATAECGQCRSVDRDRCPEGERLYRAWIDVCDDAYRQLAGDTP